jgi:hypothetical protein
LFASNDRQLKAGCGSSPAAALGDFICGQRVQRAAHRATSHLQHVGVDHRRGHIDKGSRRLLANKEIYALLRSLFAVVAIPIGLAFFVMPGLLYIHEM